MIDASIKTLQRDLLEEAVIVSVVIVIFLFHFGSALIAINALPIAVLVSFLPIYLLGVSSNIMSLGGLALAIGFAGGCIDRDVENGYRHLSERQEHDPTAVAEPERREILINATKQVGPALFFCLLIIVVSFLPVFPFGGAGRTHVPPPRLDEVSRGRIVFHSCNHSRSLC